MKRLLLLLPLLLGLALAAPFAAAQSADPAAAAAPATSAPATPAPAPGSAVAAHDATTAAAAAVVVRPARRPPDFLEHLVDAILDLFNVRSSGNTIAHYVIAGLLLIGSFLLRRVVTDLIFHHLKKVAARTKTTLDDKLFPALETPTATLISVAGMVAALKVLKLSVATDNTIGYASTIAFSLVILWGVLRAFNAVLDHAREIALQRQLGIAAFLPWIKKTLLAVFGVFGALLIIQSLGYDVKTLLAGLGLGGLAFALAAQDTLANVFGSVVVATDQPFKIGEFVKIGNNLGLVEDIGLRSTRLRAADKSLVVIPNKSVASEAITNLSRFTQRRFEQVIGLTYDTRPEQMEAIIAEVRRLILAEAEIDPASVMVFFRDFNASSLDLWIVYMTKSPDFAKAMALKQRLNLAFMRAVYAEGLSFAFPTQTVVLDGPVARQLAEPRGALPPPTAG
ncbi:mechanosensitive ion channel family protein [Horticoccus luteus]|uniref:Mechanosensitive ion channel family protein n=1 Tax=Horticoccus luteus TaxID=2862869 RepID=A0A8F9TU88_9BACT|nr:mechanosensitive ion channel domain-containing protein [Horticoccus luteus]QYM79171.1 mechanosensitive ion channel family protein [Horticoccus luteus]